MTQTADNPIAGLRDGFNGSLVEPVDPSYDESRRVWNGAIDRRPRVVARCLDEADVQAAVRFATATGWEIAVRGGAHSMSGASVVDDGIVIDLSRMNQVRVDPENRRAVVAGGALLSDVDAATQAHGLAVPAGLVSHTGVGGLTLGGGMGWLTRQGGLTIDNMLSARVVTADGGARVASPSENAELFWAIRGGGGNFGVVTEFEFQLHPFGPEILSVDLAYPIDEGPKALRALLAMAEDSPDALVAGAAIVTARPSPMLPDAFHGKPVVFISYTYADDVEVGKGFLPRLKLAGEPIAEFVEVLPYLALQRAADEPTRHGQRQYARSHFIRSTTDDLVEAFLARAGRDPEVAANASLGQLGGAISRTGPDDGPFSGRDALFDFVVSSTWDDPAADADRLAAARAYGDAILPLSTGRSYVNAIDGDETDKVRDAFGAATYDRLVAVKDRYDPDNVFHLNQNVRPSGS